MLSYQHAYHAGNLADLHKHGCLIAMLDALTRKPRPISYIETHSGRGLYDLGSPEAVKTGEAARGIQSADLPEGRYRDLLTGIRAKHGQDAYPGSPLIAREILRDTDQLHLMELHPAEHRALKRALSAPNVSVHHRNGYEGVLAISPPTPRRGLVLVDPSYEVKTEYSEAAGFIRRLIAKWPQAVAMIWYPILPEARHHDLLTGLKSLQVLTDEVSFDTGKDRGMTGSGLAFVNAPFGTDKLLRTLHQQLSIFGISPSPR